MNEREDLLNLTWPAEDSNPGSLGEKEPCVRSDPGRFRSALRDPRNLDARRSGGSSGWRTSSSRSSPFPATELAAEGAGEDSKDESELIDPCIPPRPCDGVASAIESVTPEVVVVAADRACLFVTPEMTAGKAREE